VGSGGLAAELSLLNGSRLEVTATPLPYGCCQGLPDYAVKCGGTRFLEIITWLHITIHTSTPASPETIYHTAGNLARNLI